MVEEGDGDARVTLVLDAADLLALITGTADPAVLFFTGRLQLKGDEAHVLELAPLFRAPTESGEVDPTQVDVTKMARLFGDLSDDELRDRLKGGMRDPILGQVFARFGDYLRSDQTEDMDAVLKWTLTGRADGERDRWLVHIDHGKCTAGKDLDLDPRVTIRMDSADFLKLVTGNANPTMAFMRGKLKVKGDLGFAAQLPKLFRIPTG
jgi:putative sterol carrier protein